MNTTGYGEGRSETLDQTTPDKAISISPFLSYSLLITWFTYLTNIALPFCVFGTLSNIVNIIVFYKMGFSSVSNISLFTLALTDFSCLCISIFVFLANHPAVPNFKIFGDIPIQDFGRLIGSAYYSMLAFGSWVTVIINVERSCCVAFPMQVKRIFTSRTVVCLMGGMVIYQLASGVPRSFGMRLVWSTSLTTNSTVVYYQNTHPRLQAYSFLVSVSIPNMICFAIVVVGTVFLITKFKQSRQLRASMSSNSGKNSNELSDKDLKLVRAMILISVIYIFGAAPNVLYWIVTAIYPPIGYDDPYLGTLSTLLLYIFGVIQVIACSVNIFVYFWMGSRFKKTFEEVFFTCKNIKSPSVGRNRLNK